MSTNEKSAENRIIDATIECMETQGIHTVTVRDIASRAGVNIAAVNYYFRSKENLINEAIEASMRNTFSDVPDLTNASPEAARDRLIAFFEHFMQRSVNYPGIAKAQLYAPIYDGNYAGAFPQRFQGFLGELTDQLGSVLPNSSSNERGRIVTGIISAIIFPGLLPHLFEPLAGLDFSREYDRKEYVRKTIARLLDRPH